MYGLIFMSVIMIPNAVFALKCKDGFKNRKNYRAAEIFEQTGRAGCFAFMIINVPGTFFGWISDAAFIMYLTVDAVLALTYCALFIVFFKKNSKFRALSLSIIPSAIFLFSGIASRSVLLTVSAALFAPSHIFISYKNAS